MNLDYVIHHGARSVYGYNHLQQVFYYASYNKDNSVRCEKDVSNLAVHKHYHWRKNDVIKIWIHCKKGKIKYYLNGMLKYNFYLVVLFFEISEVHQ